MSEELYPVSPSPIPSSALAIAQTAQAYAESIIDTVREPFLIMRSDLRIQSASRSFYQKFQVTPAETEGRRIYEIGNGEWDIPALRELLEKVLPQNTRFDNYVVTHDFPGLGTRNMILNARRLYRAGNHTEFLMLAIEDATDRLRWEADREALIQNLQRELAHQRRIARSLQRPLLLETDKDAFPGLELATLYSAAWEEEAEVGGDFFDAYALTDGRVALVIGDVTGKGLAAAANAQECKDVLRAYTRMYPFYPALALTRLNDYYCEAQALDERPLDCILALCLALVHPATGEAAVAWAGIEPPLVLRKDGQVEALQGGGTLIGAKEHAIYTEAQVHLSPGDTLVLLTDGLSEARHGKTFLGQEGVIRLLTQARKQEVRQIGESLLAGARSFAGGRLQDDACLVLAQRLEGEAPITGS